MSDEARKAILARRASFIAAAMASLAAEGCGKTETHDAGAEIAPQPCLMPPMSDPLVRPDAGDAPLTPPPVMDLAPPPSATASAPAAASHAPHVKPPAPHPCLRAPPRVCLKVAPRDDGTR